MAKRKHKDSEPPSSKSTWDLVGGAVGAAVSAVKEAVAANAPEAELKERPSNHTQGQGADSTEEEPAEAESFFGKLKSQAARLAVEVMKQDSNPDGGTGLAQKREAQSSVTRAPSPSETVNPGFVLMDEAEIARLQDFESQYAGEFEILSQRAVRLEAELKEALQAAKDLCVDQVREQDRLRGLLKENAAIADRLDKAAKHESALEMEVSDLQDRLTQARREARDSAQALEASERDHQLARAYMIGRHRIVEKECGDFKDEVTRLNAQSAPLNQEVLSLRKKVELAETGLLEAETSLLAVRNQHAAERETARLGAAFIDWCRDSNPLISRAHLFARHLSERGYEDVEVTLASHRSNVVELSGSVSPTCWVAQIGRKAWMLPLPASIHAFADVSAFDADPDVAPHTLASCRPSALRVDGVRWAVVTRGHLFA